jgi:competence protein ComEA
VCGIAGESRLDNDRCLLKDSGTIPVLYESRKFISVLSMGEWWSSLPVATKMQGLLVVVGVCLMGFGLLQMRETDRNSAVVVVEEVDEEEESEKLVVVDVGGAVGQPGVYSLAAGSRVADAIAEAQGMDGDADLVYVNKILNQAEEVKDGMKIYIPTQAESQSGNDNLPMTNDKQSGVAGAATININTASQKELESLWGIGEARAKAIIENRPYSKIEEIKEKAKVPGNVYERIEKEISVY